MSYLEIMIGLILFCIAMRWLCKVTVYTSYKRGVTYTAFTFIIGVIWDSYAVANEHWTFVAHNIHKMPFGWLPAEEYLFMLVVPYWLLQMNVLLGKYVVRESL